MGKKNTLERLMIGLFSDGHVLLEGVPGLAKTLLIKSISKVISAGFQRIQFTPDLLPADIIGTLIFNQKTFEFSTKKGPIFTNVLLADEINRSPAKVQSALLEAMMERQVTIGEKSYPLDELFWVLATQNPIEQEGTYPLPEAQLDRFMLKVLVEYPSFEEELEIIQSIESIQKANLKPVLSMQDIIQIRNLVNKVYVDKRIMEYILHIVSATREPEKYKLSDLKNIIELGASPRASINLLKASKAYAFLQKRDFVLPEDIQQIGYDVLRHRIILSFEAEAEMLSTEKVVEQIFNQIEVP